MENANGGIAPEEVKKELESKPKTYADLTDDDLHGNVLSRSSIIRPIKDGKKFVMTLRSNDHGWMRVTILREREALFGYGHLKNNMLDFKVLYGTDDYPDGSLLTLSDGFVIDWFPNKAYFEQVAFTLEKARRATAQKQANKEAAVNKVDNELEKKKGELAIKPKSKFRRPNWLRK